MAGDTEGMFGIDPSFLISFWGQIPLTRIAFVAAERGLTRDTTVVVVWCLLVSEPCKYSHKLYIARNYSP